MIVMKRMMRSDNDMNFVFDDSGNDDGSGNDDDDGHEQKASL